MYGIMISREDTEAVGSGEFGPPSSPSYPLLAELFALGNLLKPDFSANIYLLRQKYFTIYDLWQCNSNIAILTFE